MKKKDLVALIHAVSGAAALIVSVMTSGQVAIPEQPIKAIGYSVFALGCFLFIYALLFLRSAFTGNIDPVRILRNGTPESVTEALADCHCQTGAHYIVAAGCEVPRGTPPANLRALVEYARSHAQA